MHTRDHSVPSIEQDLQEVPLRCGVVLPSRVWESKVPEMLAGVVGLLVNPLVPTSTRPHQARLSRLNTWRWVGHIIEQPRGYVRVYMDVTVPGTDRGDVVLGVIRKPGADLSFVVRGAVGPIVKPMDRPLFP